MPSEVNLSFTPPYDWESMSRFLAARAGRGVEIVDGRRYARTFELNGVAAARPGLRLPGAWDGFELAVRAILGQQVTVAAATQLAGRLIAAFGRPYEASAGLTHLFPTAERL